MLSHGGGAHVGCFVYKQQNKTTKIPADANDTFLVINETMSPKHLDPVFCLVSFNFHFKLLSSVTFGANGLNKEYFSSTNFALVNL